MEECEQEWLFGSRGVFNSSSGECICPEGYSGKDDWGEFGSCHVDVELALTIKKAFLGLCALQVALVLILLRNTNKNWGFTFFELPSIPWIKYGSKDGSDGGDVNLEETGSVIEASDLSKTVGENDISQQGNSSYPDGRTRYKICCFVLQGHHIFITPEYVTGSMIQNLRLERDYQRKKGALVSMNIFVSWGCFFFAIMIFQVGDDPWRKYDEDVFRRTFIGFLLTCLSTAIFASFYYLVMSLYKTLPSVRLYGKLLNMSFLLAARPALVFHVGIFAILSVFILGLVFLTLLPVMYLEYQSQFNIVFLCWSVIVILIFAIIFTVLLLEIRRTFNQMIEVLHPKTSGSSNLAVRIQLRSNEKENEIEHCKRGRNLANLFLLFGWLAAVIGGSIIIVMLVFWLRYSYLTLPALASVILILSVVVSFLLNFTDGGLLPVKERRPTNLPVSRSL
mmetsp:Transcript_15391/g.17423  ORF Transcript_15391/g.17423 Transcript_15391/m.17423 type:complete len:450 (-) Transcript_15391:934-2283(-)